MTSGNGCVNIRSMMVQLAKKERKKRRALSDIDENSWFDVFSVCGTDFSCDLKVQEYFRRYCVIEEYHGLTD